MRRLSSSNLFQQVQELREFASKQFKQNLEKYNKLKQSGVSLSFAICIPTISKKVDHKHNQLNSQKLYLQGVVNQLMKDQELLANQERKHIYQKQSQSQEKKQMNSTIYQAYGYLRSAWTQFAKTPNEQVDDHFDRLNKIVAVMKGGLQKSYSSIKNQKIELTPSQELLQSLQYQSLLQNYERVSMKYQDTVKKYEDRLLKINKQNRKLQQQNMQLKKQLQELKSKQSINNSVALASRPTILSSNIQFKPLFQNSYFQVKILRIPTDDSSYYAKCMQDLKLFIKNYSLSQQSLKQQRNIGIRNLHQFARSQDITKVKFEKTKMNLLENQKLAPQKFYTKIERLHPQLKLT